MANETNDRDKQLRAAAAAVLRWISVPPGRGSQAEDALVDALMLVDTRVTMAAIERDERTADLEALTNERDVVIHDRDRARAALAASQDLLINAGRSAEHADSELKKTRALVDELRAQLAFQSASFGLWLTVATNTRATITKNMRYGADENGPWHMAADALDSLTPLTPCVDEKDDEETRVAALTDAADKVERLTACNDRQRVTIDALRNELANTAKDVPAATVAWCALRTDQRKIVLRALNERMSETKEPSAWAAAFSALGALANGATYAAWIVD